MSHCIYLDMNIPSISCIYSMSTHPSIHPSVRPPFRPSAAVLVTGRPCIDQARMRLEIF